MTDSNSLSLMALVDSHLSKTSLQETDGDGNSRLRLPSLSGGSVSESRFLIPTGPRIVLPSFPISDSPIQNVLAEQLANMFKAKEKKKQEEENQRISEELKKLQIKDKDGSECVIDLMQALQTPFSHRTLPQPVDSTLSNSSSMESLFQTFIEEELQPEIVKTPEPILPCQTDLSYILKQKIRKGKCSEFGKVLCSRLRPCAAPYLREKVNSNIVRFDFMAKSPCDLIKEKLRKTYHGQADHSQLINQ